MENREYSSSSEVSNGGGETERERITGQGGGVAEVCAGGESNGQSSFDHSFTFFLGNALLK